MALTASRDLDEGRTSAYASAVARFTESPVLGSGPGTYGVERVTGTIPLRSSDGWRFRTPTTSSSTISPKSGIVGLIRVVGDPRPRRVGGPRVLAVGRRRAGSSSQARRSVWRSLQGTAWSTSPSRDRGEHPRHRRRGNRGDQQCAGAGFRAAPGETVARLARGRIRGGRPRRPELSGPRWLSGPSRTQTTRCPRVPPTPCRSPVKRRLRRPISSQRGGCRWRPLPRRTTRGRTGSRPQGRWIGGVRPAVDDGRDPRRAEGDRATEARCDRWSDGGTSRSDRRAQRNRPARGAGDKAGAEAAARRLLAVQPDIEPIIGARSPDVAATIASVR